MAEVKISELPPSTLPLTGGELVAGVQGGVTGNFSVEDIAQQVPGVVWVQSEDDFPAPIGGVINLDPVTYIVNVETGVDIVSRMRFTTSETIILGLNRSAAQLSFNQTTGSASIINDSGVAINIRNCFIESPISPMFDCTGSPTALFDLRECIISNCPDLGTIRDFVRTDLSGILYNFGLAGTLTITGNSDTILINNTQSAANSASGVIDLTDSGLVCNGLEMSGITSGLLTGTNKFCNIDPTKIVGGTISNCAFPSGATQPLGPLVDKNTANLIIDKAASVPDTKKIADQTIGAFTVVISSIGVPVEVGGVWTLNTSAQFSSSGKGLVFDGFNADDVFSVTCLLNGTKAGGTGSDAFTGSLLLDGVVVSKSTITVEVSDKGGSILLTAFLPLASAEEITVEIQNDDSTSNFDITSGDMRIHRVI